MVVDVDAVQAEVIELNGAYFFFIYDYDIISSLLHTLEKGHYDHVLCLWEHGLGQILEFDDNVDVIIFLVSAQNSGF